MALQWFKQPDGTMVLWDPEDGEAPISSEPENPQSTDTSDVAQQMFEQGGQSSEQSGGLLGALTSAGGAGAGKIDYAALLTALIGSSVNAAPAGEEGGQSLGATTPEGAGYTPASPTRGEESSRPAPKAGKTEAYAGGEAFVKGMIKRGWTPEEAAGAAGNVHVESGFKPYVKSSVPGEQSYGFLQWNKDRLQGLKNYAASKGKDWRDPDTQMDWIHLERTGESVKYGGTNEASAYKKAFSGGGSPAEIAQRFGRFVERPKDLSQSVKIRMSAADRYAQYAAAKPPPSPQMAQAKLQEPTPYSDQSLNEELFTALLGGSSQWG